MKTHTLIWWVWSEYREIGFSKKNIGRLKLCTQVNVILLNGNLSCYIVIDKATL